MIKIGTFKVTNVADGDTIRVATPPMSDLTHKKSLRILNIDTEETTNPKLLGPVTQYGKTVTKLAKKYFKDKGNEVILYGDNKVGFFGRPLVYVHTSDGRCYQHHAISEGWTPYYNKYGYAHSDYHRAFTNAQEQAQKDKKGIWSDKMVDRSVGRPYDDLLEWWNLRADALRNVKETHPEAFVLTNSEDYACLDLCYGDNITVFGELSAPKKQSGFFSIKVGMKKHFYAYCPNNEQLQDALYERFISTRNDLIKNNFVLLQGTLEEYKGFPEIEIHDFSQILNW